MRTTSSRLLLCSNSTDALAGGIVGLLTQLIVINQLGFSGIQLGTLNAAPLVLFLLTSIAIGRLIDSLDPTKVLLSSLIFKTAAICLMLYFYLTGGLSFWTILFLQVTQSLVGTFINNSQLVTAARLQRAREGDKLVPWIESMDQAARLIGPGIVALLVSRELYAGGYLGAVLLLLATIVMVVPIVRNWGSLIGAKHTQHSKEKASFFEGFKILASTRQSLTAIVLIASGNVGLALSDSAKDLILLRSINMPETHYSALQVFAALSGLFASVVSAKLVNRFSLHVVVFMALFGQALSAALFLLLAMTHTSPFVLAAASDAVWAVAVVTINVAVMNYLAEALPENRIGISLSSMRTFVMFFVPLGAILGGVAADTLGYTVPIALWAALTLGTLCLGAYGMRANST